MGVDSAQRGGDRNSHTFAIAQHVVVPESEHAIAFRGNHSVTLSVFGSIMLPAIYFDDDLKPMTGEICSKVSERHLLAKMSLGKSLPQQAPHGAFRVGGIAPKPAGSLR